MVSYQLTFLFPSRAESEPYEVKQPDSDMIALVGVSFIIIALMDSSVSQIKARAYRFDADIEWLRKAFSEKLLLSAEVSSDSSQENATAGTHTVSLTTLLSLIYCVEVHVRIDVVPVRKEIGSTASPRRTVQL